MAGYNLDFISYKVKGIQQSGKRIKVFQYSKKNSLSVAIPFFGRVRNHSKSKRYKR